jgi:transcriptional regulator with XRE-family HTH domain
LYDYSKLLGRIRELGFTQETLANRLSGRGKISVTSLNLTLNNRRELRQVEILALCEALRIEPEQIPLYFFTPKLTEA